MTYDVDDLLQTDVIVSSGQITDACLLGLAVHKRGRLATFDQRIPVEAVTGGQAALEMIVP